MTQYPNLPNPFPSSYEKFIHVSRYARWIEEENRRENWEETVQRLTEYYKEKVNLDDKTTVDLYTSIHQLETMPSMRSLMTAGPALERNPIASYNCAYLPVDSPRSFDEALMILMCGTGVGYSVEREYVEQLPRISEEFSETDTIIHVADSKEGWAKAFRELISLLIAGQIPKWDISSVRGAGERLKTFGGRASGPAPLVDLFEFATVLFQRSAGRRLTSLECHDLMCKIADIVVVGGVRRSAMISLFDVTEDRMVEAKVGNWWEQYGHRRLANNSAVYNDRKPDMAMFMKKWKTLYDSKAGEPGIFSRGACQRIVERSGKRDPEHRFGTNPCSEIILRPYQFCNLTEIVVRSNDTLVSLKRKARNAAILGTIQSTFTDFKYLRKIWQNNCNEERLLGVSMTGVCDHEVLSEVSDKSAKWLKEIKEEVNETNKAWAKILDIPVSAATTCIKPSGTVSQLVNSASGLHPRHSDYYYRTVRGDNKDPLTDFLVAQGVEAEPDVMAPDSTTVFKFAIASPKSSKKRDDLGAMESLELWKHLQEHWCEHKPSCTIYVKEEQWMEVGAWVYENFELMSGISFLPFDGGTYKQAPYQEITKKEFEAFDQVKIDWDGLVENEDLTTASQELACTGGQCEI